MGTSNSNGGQRGKTPLVPTWLDDPVGLPPERRLPIPLIPLGGAPTQVLPMPADGPIIPAVPARITIPPFAAESRFRTARSNFSRFASSGGRDRAALGRAVSRYVSTSTGGSRTAAQRMGSSRVASSQLLNFLSSVIANGQQQTLRFLRLESLAGRPIQEVFIGLTDYICPDGGTIDEGIAREAFIETIVDLAEAGVTDMDALTLDQMQTIFELYATNAIEARLFNDIGTNAIVLPADADNVAEVQSQLHEFINRSVSDALTAARAELQALTPVLIQGFVTRIYEQVFAVLQSLGEAESEQ